MKFVVVIYDALRINPNNIPISRPVYLNLPWQMNPPRGKTSTVARLPLGCVRNYRFTAMRKYLRPNRLRICGCLAYLA